MVVDRGGWRLAAGCVTLSGVLDPTDLTASGLRLQATYDVPGDDPAATATWLAEEMTVEFPTDLLADDGIRGHVLGRVEAVAGRTVTVSVDADVVGGSLTQLLSVVWGNVALAPGLRLVALDLPDEVAAALPCPQVGLPGLRAATGAATRPLTMSAIKPLGLPVDRLAAMAATLAAGGLDIVKEDQSLADQPWAPFDQRIGPIAEAVAAANARAGTRALYAPSLNGPVSDLSRRAAAARDAGAGAVMVQPGISGFPAIEAAASAGLPVIAHPGALGTWTDRVAPALVHGLIARLAGADVSVFITPGGRFDVSQADATAIVEACTGPLGPARPILPAAGGGITVERVPELRATYGDDLCLLIGGDLHRHGDPGRRAAQLRAAVEA